MTEQSPYIIELNVEGMSCTNCSLGIKNALEKQGFTNVNADFTMDEVTFETLDESLVPKAMKKIESLGYTVADRKQRAAGEHSKGLSLIEKKFWFTAIFTVPLVLPR